MMEAPARPDESVARDPGVLATLLLGTLLLAFALTVDFPKAAFGFQSDEATYYTLAHSLARDGDFTYERRDLARVWEEFTTGPEGIFLKRGRDLTVRATGRFPFVAIDSAPDPQRDRLYYGKAFIYPLVAAPFVLCFGTNGFLVLHAILLALDFLAAYWFLRARSLPAAALAYASVFFVASAVPVYFVWLTPEIFNLSLAILGLFLWAYREVSPTPGAGRWSRFLRSDGAVWAGAALIGVATFSKPTNLALCLPIVAGSLLGRRWRAAAGAALVVGLVAGGLFLANLAITGEWNYQGGDRNTFYGGTGFPFQTDDRGYRSPDVPRGRDAVLTDVLLTRDALLAVFPRNLGYFVFGRHTGLLPYFFPGLLSLGLFFRAPRARPGWQWALVAAFVAGSIGLLLLVPYTYSGGGGPIGNRYFMGFYALLLFVTPPLASAVPAVVALGVGALFTAQLVLNPFFVSFNPAEHPKRGAYRWLPVEKTLLNDLPVNVQPSRVRQPLAGTPPISAYFLDDNAYPREGEWFWVRGESRAEILLRGPALAQPDGSLVSLHVRRLRVELRAGDVGTTVTLTTGADRQTVALPPQGSAIAAIAVERGVPYKAHPGQPTSYVYSLAISSSRGFTPLFTSGAPDPRFLGVFVRVVPVYQ